MSSAKRPRAAKKRRSVTRAKSVRRARTSLEPQSLLILHLDADKLRHDGLHLGGVAEFSGRIANFTVGSEVVLAEASTQGELNELFAGFAKAKRTFDVVVVVGHSNERVIRIDQHTPPMLWSGFAEYLKPLMPRRLLLVACKGGRWDAGETLFRALPRLRRIFACPVNASKAFGALMLFAVPYVCRTRAPKDKHVLYWFGVNETVGLG